MTKEEGAEEEATIPDVRSDRWAEKDQIPLLDSQLMELGQNHRQVVVFARVARGTDFLLLYLFFLLLPCWLWLPPQYMLELLLVIVCLNNIHLRGRLRIISGDKYSVMLEDSRSNYYRHKIKQYEDKLNRLYKDSSLKNSIQTIKVYGFRNGSLIVLFGIFVDRMTISESKRDSANVMMAVKKVLMTELMSAHPKVFGDVMVDPHSVVLSEEYPEKKMPKITEDDPRYYIMNRDHETNRLTETVSKHTTKEPLPKRNSKESNDVRLEDMYRSDSLLQPVEFGKTVDEKSLSKADTRKSYSNVDRLLEIPTEDEAEVAMYAAIFSNHPEGVTDEPEDNADAVKNINFNYDPWKPLIIPEKGFRDKIKPTKHISVVDIPPRGKPYHILPRGKPPLEKPTLPRREYAVSTKTVGLESSESSSEESTIVTSPVAVPETSSLTSHDEATSFSIKPSHDNDTADRSNSEDQAIDWITATSPDVATLSTSSQNLFNTSNIVITPSIKSAMSVTKSKIIQEPLHGVSIDDFEEMVAEESHIVSIFSENFLNKTLKKDNETSHRDNVQTYNPKRTLNLVSLFKNKYLVNKDINSSYNSWLIKNPSKANTENEAHNRQAKNEHKTPDVDRKITLDDEGVNNDQKDQVKHEDRLNSKVQLFATTTVPSGVESPNKSNRNITCNGFLCKTGTCIPKIKRCNQIKDCWDNSDEKDCKCSERMEAMLQDHKICDGVADCADYSDESNCRYCKTGQYKCPNSRRCINQSQVCDGLRDCPDSADEAKCMMLSPGPNLATGEDYQNSGYLMVRRNGLWGHMCMDRFNQVRSESGVQLSLGELGQVVCNQLTYSKHQQTHTVYSRSTRQHDSGQDGGDFLSLHPDTKCLSKRILHVSCSSLECGIRPNNHKIQNYRIVGGENAEPGSWPWHAALYKEGKYQCGATLISDRWLLSAAHCFNNFLEKFWVARLGLLRRGAKNIKSPYEVIRRIEQIFIHENYIESGFVNDISLLKMDTPVTYSDFVRPVCLPKPSTPIQNGKMCTVIGWGQLYEIGNVYPDTLQEVRLPLITTESCRERTVFTSVHRVTDHQFCAGYDRGGRDACVGDSGGPILCQEHTGQWTLMGVTSNGFGCARPGYPGVYTKVTDYLKWTNNVIGVVKAIFAKFCKLFLAIFGGFRRALCCWRRRKNINDFDSLPFRIDSSAIRTESIQPIPTNESIDLQNWHDWDELNVSSSPPTASVATSNMSLKSKYFNGIHDAEEPEYEPNYFEDMTPTIQRQKRLLIKPAEDVSHCNNMNRLNYEVQHPVLQTQGADLGTWNESTEVNSWEDNTMKDVMLIDAENILREERRAERQKRTMEQLKRKNEKDKNKKINFMATKSHKDGPMNESLLFQSVLEKPSKEALEDYLNAIT
ncbi:Atrial natriuretic peptide-converting enzyme [Nymphon striatum]|nr:Atrial natriuretic peptide-converting enzyme [Nymphon striatum]